MIPRVIHQVFLGYDSPRMPPGWSKNHDKWKQLHPDYEVLLWNMAMSEQLINDVDPSFYKTFKSYKHHVQRADAIRYFILYVHGGVYVDLDVVPTRNITPLLQLYEVSEYKAMLCSSTNVAMASNWFMMSVPKSEFWMDIVAEMKRRASNFYGFKHFDVMNKTGPGLVNDMLNKSNLAIIIPPSILHSKNVCGKEETKSLKYIRDENAKSWNGADTKLINGCYCLFGNIQANIVYFVILLLVVVAIVVSARGFKRTCPNRGDRC